MTRKCGQNYAGGINHRDDYTDKTPDVDFRTYNRMPQDQTVQGAENVSCLWAAEIHLHFRSFPPSSEFSGDFPEVFGNFRRFLGNFRRFSQRKNKRVRTLVTMVGIELTSFGLLI